MLLDFARGFRDMLALTCFRGPWAYQCMAEAEASDPETAYDFGARVAVVLVRGDERRRAERRTTQAKEKP